MTLVLLALCFALPRVASRVPPPHEDVARMARFVVNKCDWASMATISSREPVRGQPFSNIFSISDGPAGNGSGTPYMYLTHLEISVQDLQVKGSEACVAEASLFSRHPEMREWPEGHQWFFAKMNISQVWVLDYFGGVKTVTVEEYYNTTTPQK